MSPIKYSVVSPVYGCLDCLSELCKRLVKVLELQGQLYEIILVDDKSDNKSWQLIKALSSQNDKIKGIELSRNFGQHNAITCGLAHATGDWIIIMDCDLQDQPEEIPNLIAKTEEGFDIVLASRANRKDGFFKRTGSKLFYAILSYLTDTKQDHTVANFGVYSKRAIAALLSMEDYLRYFPTMVQWVGFEKAKLPVNHASREAGNSGYSFRKLLRLAIDNIISFSDRPLKLMIYFGLLLSSISFLIAFYYFILYQLGEIVQLGFTSLILSIWFLFGIAFIILGTIGLYLGKTFETVKKRPLYIVKDTSNLENE